MPAYPLRSGVDLSGLYGRWISRNYILNKERIMGGAAWASEANPNKTRKKERKKGI
jgi:hypothetical protein